MKRRDPTPMEGTVLRMLSDFARSRNLSIHDTGTHDQFLGCLSEALVGPTMTPIRLNGFRTQAMFAYLAAALGQCAIITEEDSGSFFDTKGSLKRPDFRILTQGNQQFLVEVKNHHPKMGLEPYTFKTEYLKSIGHYADLMGMPLKFAIYWSRLRIWTLTNASRLSGEGAETEISIEDALKMNEMASLGDISVGSVPPLAIRIHADTAKKRTLNKSGKVRFTISKAALYSAGTEITEPEETRLAWMLMHYGNWKDCRQTVKIENDQIEYVEISVAPKHPVDGQGFDIVGSMSTIISRQYIEATSEGPKMKTLEPADAPDEFGAIIAPNYQGKALHLWRFSQQPHFSLSPNPALVPHARQP